MRAVTIREQGGVEVLDIAEVDPPRPGPGQVVLRALAVGINFGDILIRRGVYPMPIEYPYTPGFELVGEVIATGEGVARIRSGDRVAAMAMGGAYAEQVLVDATNAFPAPEGLSAESLVAVLIQGLTAWGLLQAGRLREGESVLVNSAAGGVGDLLVQLAVLRGASPLIGAASQASKLERVEASGATHVLDYDRCTKEQLLQLTSGSGLDLVLDAVGGAVRDVGLSAMAPFGRAVLYGTSSGELAGLTGEQLIDVLMGNKSIIGFGLLDYVGRHPEFVGEAWAGLTSALTEGRLDVIHRAFPLEEVRAAQAAMERRETIGKLVLVP